MPNLFHAILFSCCLHISHCKLEKVMTEGDAGGTMSVTLHGVTDTLSPENKKYAGALKAAAEAFHDAEEIFNDPTYADKTGWWEDKTNDDGDIVYAKDTPKGRMVTVSAEMPFDVDNVMTHTWKDVATLPQWNPNINFASVIASPTDNFDVINVMGKIMLMDTENNRKHFGELAKQKANGGAAKN
ncbi:hypothetical protein WR25_16548 isoform A [Diploscapter pachys]|uniref:START domain-containing protein n=1 Tax=Diploscapter pachys TaxID=2018661 RepID=A0A2A2J4G8_9BILA|nr:hypothetical protein WR25_16548 isoform A [Diploscapter pachys]